MPGGELRQLWGCERIPVRVAASCGCGSRRPATGVRGETDPTEATRQALQTGRDAVDLFVETVVGLVEARFADLTYDRTALVAWLQETGAEGPRPSLRRRSG